MRKHGLCRLLPHLPRSPGAGREVAAEVRGNTARAAQGCRRAAGRGSSVSSILCYLIGLSHIDPIKYNLFLGRFLNDEIASVPDIDLDFPRDIREQLILRVYEHFGREHAALVASFPTYQLRSAIRDVGKALGLPPRASSTGWRSAPTGSAAEAIGEEMAL